jgi:hypothetical protein
MSCVFRLLIDAQTTTCSSLRAQSHRYVTRSPSVNNVLTSRSGYLRLFLLLVSWHWLDEVTLFIPLYIGQALLDGQCHSLIVVE